MIYLCERLFPQQERKLPFQQCEATVISPQFLYTPATAAAMLAHRRQRLDFAAGNHFSFTRPVSDHLEYGDWAESIKTPINSFGRRDPGRKLGPWARSIPLSKSSSSAACDDDDSDGASPPLWKSSSPEYRPNISRAQMIAKYRQDMIDLVRNLPETAYELSLRDLVESPVTIKREMATAEEEEAAALTERGGSEDGLEMKKQKRKVRERRRRLSSGSKSESMDISGFLLKLLVSSMPAVLCGGRRESSGVARTDSKVLPRPMAAAADGEWSNCEYGERSSSNGSSNSIGGGRGRKRWKLSECYSFLYGHRWSSSRKF